MSDINPYEEGLALELQAAQKRIEALEAKLAKAAETLKVALRYNSAMHGGAGAYNKRLKDAIAEIEGA